MAAPSLWYFGYGSNMDPRTFLGRRGMRPERSAVARLDDHALRFDLPIGPGERGVANVVPEAGAEVWGVAYLLSADQAGRLDRTEGVHRGFYVRREISLDAGDDGSLSAFTYHSARGAPGRKPSRRYMRLLLAGCQHHGLPQTWVDHLRALPLAIDERNAQQDLF